MTNKCGICEMEKRDRLVYIEGLYICQACVRELDIETGIKPVSGFPVYKKNRSTRNVHLNGSPACAPRPYGQLPGNGG